MSFQMFVPTKALFGAGQLNHLHEQDLPGKKALLVISNGKSTKVNGYLDRTEKNCMRPASKRSSSTRSKPIL